MLVVDSVSVSLGGRSVLDAVSLEVSAGEVVAVFGPSGLLLMIILGHKHNRRVKPD